MDPQQSSQHQLALRGVESSVADYVIAFGEYICPKWTEHGNVDYWMNAAVSNELAMFENNVLQCIA